MPFLLYGKYSETSNAIPRYLAILNLLFIIMVNISIKAVRECISFACHIRYEGIPPGIVCLTLMVKFTELTKPSLFHYCDVIMGGVAFQITIIVYSNFYSDADQRKHQSSTSLAFVRGIHRGPVNSPYKWPVTRKMFPFDDVIICLWLNLIIT